MRVQSLESTDLDVTSTDLLFQISRTSFDGIAFSYNVGPTSLSGVYHLDNVLVTTDAADLNFAVIPEPSSTALLGLGGLALMLRRRR